MLFSNADIGLLRLAGWCKDLPPDLPEYLIRPRELEALETVGLIRAGQTLRLRPAGYRLLQELGWDYPADTKYRSDYSTIARRLEAARIILTCHRAGIDVFADCLGDLAAESVYLSSSAVRRNKKLGGNLYQGVRFAGILRSGERFQQVHYLGDSQRKMYYSNEMKTFHNIIAPLEPKETALVFAGRSYLEVWSFLTSAAKVEGRRKNDALLYPEAYQAAELPVCLLSCDDTGAVQLQIMGQPEYRRIITEAGLYRPAEEHPEYCDGFLGQAPLVIAVDMDVKRVSSCIRLAKEAGYQEVAVAALRGQITGLLSRLFRSEAKLYEITPKILRRAFPDLPELYAPSRLPYLKEGRPFHVSSVPAPVQAGGQAGKETREMAGLAGTK